MISVLFKIRHESLRLVKFCCSSNGEFITKRAFLNAIKGMVTKYFPRGRPSDACFVLTSLALSLCRPSFQRAYLCQTCSVELKFKLHFCFLNFDTFMNDKSSFSNDSMYESAPHFQNVTITFSQKYAIIRRVKWIQQLVQ